MELGLPTYFILKRNRFLTTTIFTGSASTVHNSLKIMLQTFKMLLSRLFIINNRVSSYQIKILLT